MIYTIEFLREADPRLGPHVVERANMQNQLDLVIDHAKRVFTMRRGLGDIEAVRIMENGEREVFRWAGEDSDA